MRLPIFLFAALAVALPTFPPPAASSNNTLVRRGFAVCETSLASSLISEINRAIDELTERGGECDQSNTSMFGSKCKEVAHQGRAQISMCGEYGRLPCTEVARGAREVRDRCEWEGRAGGWWDFNDTPVNAVVH